MRNTESKSTNDIAMKHIAVNGVEYCYLEAGSGPLVLLVHGYPDNAYSWEHQIRFLAQQGFRAVAPFTRGYEPTHVPVGSYFDRSTLANDMASLIDALKDGGPAYYVGQDWGAAIGYGVLGAFPDRVRRAVLLAIPHPLEINRTLRRSPKHIFRSFHWFLFQLPVLPEYLIRFRRGAFLRFLWRLWSPDFQDSAHVDQVIEKMLQGRCVEDTLSYYRAALQQRFRDPALKPVFERLDDPIRVPTKVLCGKQDMRRECLAPAAQCFTPEADYQWQLIDGAGHFLHRERVDEVNAAILDWLRKDSGDIVAA